MNVNENFRPGVNEIRFLKEKVRRMLVASKLALESKGPGGAGLWPDLGIPHLGPF